MNGIPLHVTGAFPFRSKATAFITAGSAKISHQRIDALEKHEAKLQSQYLDKLRAHNDSLDRKRRAEAKLSEDSHWWEEVAYAVKNMDLWPWYHLPCFVDNWRLEVLEAVGERQVLCRDLRKAPEHLRSARKRQSRALPLWRGRSVGGL